MKAGAGKRKGSSFEREFCKALSLWWTGGGNKDVFWRTHSSGARHGIQEEAGDVMAVKVCGAPLTDRVFIELKCWKVSDLLLDLLRPNKKSQLEDAWLKCIQEAEQNKKAPLLVVKITNKTTICLTRQKDGLIELDNPDNWPNVLLHVDGLTSIMEWDKFLSLTTLGSLREVAEITK